MARREILLESGTNEVEIIEFLLGSQSFGVNVAKVREILQYSPNSVTAVPDTFHSVMGMFILREATVSLIDLMAHIGLKHERSETDRKVVMVCEFNNMVNGFLVDGVVEIHRCSWSDITPISPFISQFGPSVTSSITINGRNILLLDLEHVITDIYPETKLIYSEEQDPEHANDIVERHVDREHVRVILAEDSPIVRSSVKKITTEVGYTNITMFDNGMDAYLAVVEEAEKAEQEGKNILEYLHAVVSDIEMPQMDGLTLCRKVKEELGLKELPVIIFSSLVNDQMIQKCKSVNADAWSNKLEVADLIHLLDRFCLKK